MLVLFVFDLLGRLLQRLGGFTMCSLTGGLAYTWPLYLLLGLATALIHIERGALVRSPVAAGPGPVPAGARFDVARALSAPSPEAP